MLSCAQPCPCVVSRPVANLQSRWVAANRPTFAQQCQRVRFRATPHASFFYDSFAQSTSCSSPAQISKDAPQRSDFFNVLKYKCSSRSVLCACFLSITFADRGPTRGNRDLLRQRQKPHYPSDGTSDPYTT